MFNCFHKLSLSSCGLYWSSASSEIFCRFAVFVSCCQRLACIVLRANTAISGRGTGLHSVISPVLIKSKRYVLNHFGLLSKRSSLCNLAAMLLFAFTRFATTCHPSGPLHPKCMLSAYAMTPSSPPKPFRPIARNWLDHTKLFMDRPPLMLCRRVTSRFEPTASANDSEDKAFCT